jgi:hypothetical protein
MSPTPGCTRYSRRFVGTGEVECWTVTAFAGIEAEVDRFGSAPIESDEWAIAQMIERLGLHWTESNFGRFRQRARTLVREERRSIRVLADALLERRTMSVENNLARKSMAARNMIAYRRWLCLRGFSKMSEADAPRFGQ